jgi:hypothetical protein
MFCAKNQVLLTRSGVMADEISKLFSEALRRRLHPNTGLTVDQLAYSIGCNPMTLRGLMRGQGTPSAKVTWGCCNFFAKIGDSSWLPEIMPEATKPLQVKAEEADKAIKFTRAITSAFSELGAVA